MKAIWYASAATSCVGLAIAGLAIWLAHTGGGDPGARGAMAALGGVLVGAPWGPPIAFWFIDRAERRRAR